MAPAGGGPYTAQLRPVVLPRRNFYEPRTPACFREPSVRAVLGLAGGERVVSLIHLGPRLSEPPVKERLPLEEVLTLLP